MNTGIALNHIIRPTLELMGGNYQGEKAEVLLVAIALQESRFTHRRQVRGPARGYWQFEQGGGVHGVLSHRASRTLAKSILDDFNYPINEPTVHQALADNDIIACVFARLLLWTDAKALPEVNDPDEAWAYYYRNWRPGKPHRATWNGLHLEARNVVGV